jgi:hypothetical protein
VFNEVCYSFINKGTHITYHDTLPPAARLRFYGPPFDAA